MTQTMEDQTNSGLVPTTTSAEPEAESEIHPELRGDNTISRVSEDHVEELESSDPMPVVNNVFMVPQEFLSLLSRKLTLYSGHFDHNWGESLLKGSSVQGKLL